VGYKIGDDDPVYCLEGSIAISGALVQWLRDNLHIIKNSNEVEALAASVPDNGGVYFVPAFSGLFAPYWHSNARGIVIGLSGHSTDAHIARAALEATAFQTREVLDAIVQDSSILINLLKVDGGMVRNNLLMQFQSDILNIEVIRPKVTETTALGAAYAAGLATGYWKDKEELISNWEKDKSWNPIMPEAQREEILSRWKLAVNRSMNWIG
jgi:glycerol kinase